MRWKDVKPGDVLHWCLASRRSNHYAVLAATRTALSVRLKLLDLMTGETIHDSRDGDFEVAQGVWTVDRATLPSERSEKQ